MIELGKVSCSECNWQGHENEVLIAPNPFNLSDNVKGCPKCYGINSINRICDEPGCLKITTCRFSTVNGYRRTCGRHCTFTL